MRVHLKIKNKNLADESRTIRTEEQRLRRILHYKRAKNVKAQHPTDYHNFIVYDEKGKEIVSVVGGWDKVTHALHRMIMTLSHHRRLPVRKERRSSHLAYNFLKDTPYKEVESFCYTEPDWSSVERMILRYGEDDERIIRQKFEEWRTG